MAASREHFECANYSENILKCYGVKFDKTVMNLRTTRKSGGKTRANA